MRSSERRANAGFSLVELLVVMGIIVILIGFSLPMIGKIRRAAKTTASQAFVSQLARAIETYQSDFRAYPGPLTNNQISVTAGIVFPASSTITSFKVISTAAANGYDATDNLSTNVTMSENLVLGLLGGLIVNGSELDYDPKLVGNGAMNLGGIPKRNTAYADGANLSWRTANNLKTGQFADDAGSANDTIIPEFVDQFNDPMPILYLRAKVGAQSTNVTNTDNSVITYDASDAAARTGQYDLHQIIGYTATTIGVGRTLPTYNPTSYSPTHGLSQVDVTSTMTKSGSTGFYPYDAYAYFRNNALSTSTTNSVPYQKDGFILISAGPDRVYGTSDDITNFGAVGQ